MVFTGLSKVFKSKASIERLSTKKKSILAFTFNRFVSVFNAVNNVSLFIKINSLSVGKVRTGSEANKYLI